MAKCEAGIMAADVIDPKVVSTTNVVVVETDAQKEVKDKASTIKLSKLDMNVLYKIYETPYEKLITDDAFMEIVATDPYYMSALTDVSPNAEIVMTTDSKKIAKGVEPPKHLGGTIIDLVLGRLKCKPMDVRLINVRKEDQEFQDGETPI